MKTVSLIAACTLLCALALASPRVSSQEPATVAQVYYIKAKPGKMEEYNRYIREVAGPIDEEARKHGAFISLTTFLATKPDSPWTHMRVFALKDRAQLANLQKALDDAKVKLEPDRAKRQARDDYAATLRDFVSSEILEILP